MREWYYTDDVNFVGCYLGAASLASFAATCRAVASNMRSPRTLRWLADLHGLDDAMHISSLELLSIAASMSTVASSIEFKWGSFEVAPAANPGLRSLAATLQRHAAVGLKLKIEAHCGLEARFHLPYPGQAQDFSEPRAVSVARRLIDEAAASGIELSAQSIETTSFGFGRPLIWAFDPDGLREHRSEFVDFHDAVSSSRNRRVELYLWIDNFEVPRRRPRSSIPVPPGAPALTDLAPGEADSLISATAIDPTPVRLGYQGENGGWIIPPEGAAHGEFFMYRYISRESCSQFDSLPLTSLTYMQRTASEGRWSHSRATTAGGCTFLPTSWRASRRAFEEALRETTRWETTSRTMRSRGMRTWRRIFFDLHNGKLRAMSKTRGSKRRSWGRARGNVRRRPL
jgi:hypothetical protein